MLSSSSRTPAVDPRKFRRTGYMLHDFDDLDLAGAENNSICMTLSLTRIGILQAYFMLGYKLLGYAVKISLAHSPKARARLSFDQFLVITIIHSRKIILR